ncbi:GNAT family N-acetyltransferase [Kitasatospora sp. NPDC008050]|uniref:GNAT family N-acetyltransferase n=1 Tax=Kitasatospora sp. NPDC008050 TaxID=3364021 RepID=UPI0036F0E6FC
MTDIVTRRLRLRRFSRDDAPALARYRSDPRVARYQSWRSPLDQAEAVAIITDYLTENPDGPGFFQYAIELDQRPGLIGDLAVAIETGRSRAVMGITLSPDMHHQGYATEAMIAVADRLFTTGVERITATCDARNSASARLLRRVGFEQQGRENQYVEQRGRHADVLVFRMSAEQLRPLRNLPGTSRVPTAITDRTHARSEQENSMDPARPGDRSVKPADESEARVDSVTTPSQLDESGDSGEPEA